MAINIMNIVWCVEGISSTDKLILLMMADCANGEDADGIFPSIEYIGQCCSLSRRATQIAVKRLRIKGFVEVVTEANSKKIPNQKARYRKTTEYKLNMDRVMQSLNLGVARKRRVDISSLTGVLDAPVNNVEQGHNMHGYRRISRTGTSAYRAPNPSIEPSKEKYIDILGQKIFTGDRGSKDNPLYFDGAVMKVYRREHCALQAATGLSDDNFYEFLSQQDDWLFAADESKQNSWMALTLGLIKKRFGYGDRLGAFVSGERGG